MTPTALPVAWIANRNALCALVLALCVLLLHDRAAREQDREAKRGRPDRAPAGAARRRVRTGGHRLIFSRYALFLDPRPRKPRCARSCRTPVVAAVWSIVYRALGYGARGSGLVVDPGSEPLRYLGARGSCACR